MAKIYIFRHGETLDNKSHTFSGFRNVPLDENGIQEARQIAQKLKDVTPTKAYQSDQIRSKETLEIVLGNNHPSTQIITDPRIKERDYGDLTGLNKDEIAKLDPKDYTLWHRSYNTAPPNGESIQMVEVRVLDFLKEVIPTWKSNDVIFISASANSIRPMRRYFEKLTIEQMCSYEYTPAQIFEYQI
ncbi:MAG: histidine phosphatase family protein [Candidatus Levybacteria bacterium]|nr:histidine phosphatase family protein [Candidatus Levybacteria bacterium]